MRKFLVLITLLTQTAYAYNPPSCQSLWSRFTYHYRKSEHKERLRELDEYYRKEGFYKIFSEIPKETIDRIRTENRFTNEEGILGVYSVDPWGIHTIEMHSSLRRSLLFFSIHAHEFQHNIDRLAGNKHGQKRYIAGDPGRIKDEARAYFRQFNAMVLLYTAKDIKLIKEERIHDQEVQDTNESIIEIYEAARKSQNPELNFVSNMIMNAGDLAGHYSFNEVAALSVEAGVPRRR